MKINWAGGITKSLLFIFCVAVVGYEAVKLIKQQRNPLNELFQNDTLVFALSIVIPIAIVIGLVCLGVYAIRGYTKPKFNWEAYLYRMGIVLIIAGIVVIGAFSFFQEPVVRLIVVVIVALGVGVSSDSIEKALENTHDDDYDDVE